MKTVMEVADFDALLGVLRRWNDRVFPGRKLDAGDVSVTPYGGIDKRIGWDTYLISIHGAAWGMSDGPIA